jgi:ubiquinone/menaquinone biosynthesis C-methylase UbiE
MEGRLEGEVCSRPKSRGFAAVGPAHNCTGGDNAAHQLASAKRGRPCSTSYGNMAGVYRYLEFLYFGDVTRRSRNCFLQDTDLEPRRVLEIGCGEGTFAAAMVARKNPSVMCINDISERMLALAEYRIRQTGWAGELKLFSGDAMDLDQCEQFDLIAIHYVLSIFPMAFRQEFISGILRHLAPGGTVLIADFSRPLNPVMLPLYYVNWTVTVLLFWVLAGNKPNVLGNMDALFSRVGLSVVRRRNFVGGLFASWTLRKAAPIAIRLDPMRHRHP